MTTRARVAAGTVGALVAGGIAAAGAGRAAWERESARAVGRLRAAATAARRLESETGSVSDLPVPPKPVRRYLRWAIPEGAEPVRLARIRWRGEFRMRPGAKWAPFSAYQEYSLRPPGFVWDARIHLFPGMTARVRDGYLAGAGTVSGRLGGVFPLAHAGGPPEIAQSALARWLGEAVWFPTALLPGGAVTWQTIDDTSARALVVDCEVRAEGEFRFGPSGEVFSVRAIRFRDVGGQPVATPFEGRFGSYTSNDGFHIPREAEAAWLLEDGAFVYWRGRVAEVEYEG